MKIYEYTRCWSMDETEKMNGELYSLLIDYPYSFPYADQENNIRLIPSFNVLNELLKSGGDHGGMSPGNIWNGFEISKKEYKKLIDKLLNLDLGAIKETHFYAPNKFILDEELNNEFEIPTEWEKQQRLKYLGVHQFIQFYDDEHPTLLKENDELGKIEIFGTAGGPRYFGRLLDSKDEIYTIKNEEVDAKNIELINEWFEDEEMLKSKKWFKPKSNLKFYVTDSWGRLPKVLELYIAENNFIAFKTEFEEIKPKMK